MTEFDGMFQAGGNYAPSFKFGEIGANVAGTILSLEQQDQTDYKDRDKKLYDKKGNVKQQLQIILETPLRNWQGVARIPADPDTQYPLPPSKDDGRRAIYVKGWMIGAVGEAVEKATGRRGAPQVGGKLAVRFAKTRPSRDPQDNDIKLYEARYEPPSPADQMFAQQQAPQQWQQPAPPQAPQQSAPQQSAPQQAPQPAPQQWQQPAAPQAPAPADDPWGNFTDTPPF